MDQGAVDAVGAPDICPVHPRVVAAVFVVDRTDQRQFAHALRHAGQQFGDSQAVDIGGYRAEGAADFQGRVGLRIPEVDVAWGPPVENQNDRAGLPVLRGHRPGPLGESAREREEDFGQSTKHAGVEKRAPMKQTRGVERTSHVGILCTGENAPASPPEAR